MARIWRTPCIEKRVKTRLWDASQLPVKRESFSFLPWSSVRQTKAIYQRLQGVPRLESKLVSRDIITTWSLLIVNSVKATEGAVQAKKTSTKTAGAKARKTRKGTTRNPTPTNPNADGGLPQANATRNPVPVNANASSDLPQDNTVNSGALQAEIDRLNRKCPLVINTISNDLLFSEELDNMRRQSAAGPSQVESAALIPRPEGSEFSLQGAMELEDDYRRYVDLRVSPN